MRTGILAEADGGLADRADRAALDVRHAATPVEHLAPIEIVKERVDREVAAERVLVGFTEDVVAADEEVVLLVGLALAEHVGGVAPERGDLDDLAAAEEDVREPEATADDAAVAEERADVVRARARRDVEVLGATVQEEVANAAADEIGLVAGAFEPPDDLRGVGVDRRPRRAARHGAGGRSTRGAGPRSRFRHGDHHGDRLDPTQKSPNARPLESQPCPREVRVQPRR